jgi:hypothetical protein
MELADLLLQLLLFLLCLELMLGQQLAPPGEHFFPEDEIRLSPGEVHLPPVQGLLLCLEVLLGEGGVAGLALKLLLSFLQPFHSLDQLGPLGFQSLVQGVHLRPNTTSISSRAGGGLELDVPLASPPVFGAGADPPAGTSAAAATPPDAGAAAAGSPAGAWEAAGAVLAAAGGGPPASPSADSCY